MVRIYIYSYLRSDEMEFENLAGSFPKQKLGPAGSFYSITFFLF